MSISRIKKWLKNNAILLGSIAALIVILLFAKDCILETIKPAWNRYNEFQYNKRIYLVTYGYYDVNEEHKYWEQLLNREHTTFALPFRIEQNKTYTIDIAFTQGNKIPPKIATIHIFFPLNVVVAPIHPAEGWKWLESNSPRKNQYYLDCNNFAPFTSGKKYTISSFNITPMDNNNLDFEYSITGEIDTITRTFTIDRKTVASSTSRYSLMRDKDFSCVSPDIVTFSTEEQTKKSSRPADKLASSSGVVYSHAQNNNENVDWDKIEHHLYDTLKAEQPDKSEAEIEEAVGYALLMTDNQWEKATVHFKKAIELNPKLYFSWYNLGLINIDTEEGYNYFQKATEAKPDFPVPYYWMAYYRCRNREDKKAIPLFQKYLELAKGDKEEAGRIKVAEEVLQDLLAGREGQSLSMMRRMSEDNE